MSKIYLQQTYRDKPCILLINNGDGQTTHFLDCFMAVSTDSFFSDWSEDIRASESGILSWRDDEDYDNFMHR